MYKTIIFAVKSKNNRTPDVAEDKFALCKMAMFEYPADGVCIVKAVIDDMLDTDAIAATLPMIEYDISRVDNTNIETACKLLNESKPVVGNSLDVPNGL